MYKWKIICLLLVLVLVIGCFAGCQQAPKGPIENEDGTLADWMKEEIEKHSRTVENYDITWYEEDPMLGTRYYGTENGYVFLFNYAMAQMVWRKVIGEYTFEAPMEFVLLAYKNNKIYKIEDLYKEGVLSDACIGKIYSVHCAYQMAG